MYRFSITYFDGNQWTYYADTDSETAAINSVNGLLSDGYQVCLFDAETYKRKYFKLAE